MEKITEIEAVEESKRSKNCLLAINISRAEVPLYHVPPSQRLPPQSQPSDELPTVPSVSRSLPSPSNPELLISVVFSQKQSGSANNLFRW
ncbi:unnamed protein product [Citrullus colocynthis]|uniref:Uncharacterized protein n=1 Tax=Citrullus colocynthis TaxID=252529 RepID=A0ABP0ZAG7_9ROSI